MPLVKWLLMPWEDFFFLSEPIPWLFSPGQSDEKPYSLVKGHLPGKTSSGPWLEIAGQVRSCLRCRECVKLPPRTWCFTQGHSSHQTLSPWLWNVCGLQRQFFWFWCPHTNCQHTVSFFFAALWCTWRGFFLEQEATVPNVFKTEAPKHLKFNSEFPSRNLARSPPFKKKNLQSCSIKYILPNRKQTSDPKTWWSTIISCFFSTGHRFSKSFVLPFNPFSTQYSFLPFYSTNIIMLLYVCIYSLWLCWGSRLVLAHTLCLEQCWYVGNVLWKFSHSGWSYKPSYPLPSPSPAYHVSSKPCWLLFVQNND